MQLGPRYPSRAVLVLGVAGGFVAAVWGVTMHLLFLDAPPLSMGQLLLLLVPAVLATLALAFGGGLWFAGRRPAGAQEAVTAAGQSRPAVMQNQPHAAAERDEAETRRIDLLLDCAAPGAALFDTQHRLLAWSRGFAGLAEVPEAALHPGLPLADLVRLQPASQTAKLSRHGIESGVAGAARRQRGDGSHVEDRWTPAAEGGTLLACRLAELQHQAGPLSAYDLAALCEEEVRTRLPRLQAAITARDAVAARMEAHAIRGVAASFGLEDLAEALLALETAARAGDFDRLAAAGSGLPELAGAALRRLARPAP